MDGLSRLSIEALVAAMRTALKLPIEQVGQTVQAGILCVTQNHNVALEVNNLAKLFSHNLASLQM